MWENETPKRSSILLYKWVAICYATCHHVIIVGTSNRSCCTWAVCEHDVNRMGCARLFLHDKETGYVTEEGYDKTRRDEQTCSREVLKSVSRAASCSQRLFGKQKTASFKALSNLTLVAELQTSLD